jgi:glyoxylase-like metal-dependent hydrolase (beta-lactamase superfamily II)
VRKFCIVAFAVILALVVAWSAERSNALKSAAKALGTNRIQTVQFVALGDSYTVGQNFSANDLWPRVPIRDYTALLDYKTGSIRVDMLREMGASMPRGGGVPFAARLRQIQMISGKYAWNELAVPGAPPLGAVPATPCTIPEAGGTSPAGPAPESRDLCMLMLWMMPQGFVKAAQANNATLTKVNGGVQVSFTFDGKHKMIGIINNRDQVERVRTWVAQSIVGDMLVEAEYTGYRDFGGVQFPSHFVQKQDGFPSLDLSITSVTPNPDANIAAPDNVRNAAPVASPTVNSQRVADGVYFLTGGTHHSLAVEMNSYSVLIDTPNGEARAAAVIAKTKELIPRKPIRYIVAMHHHWDHLGGIRTAIDEGAIIVTHDTNKAFLERAANAPHTINPDRLAFSKKQLKLQIIGSEGMLSDGSRTIKLYTITGFDHTDDMLMVYLPNEKILAEADAYTPPDFPDMPLIAPKVPYAAAFYDNIRRLHLDVRTIVPFHGARTVDLAEVAGQAGKPR